MSVDPNLRGEIRARIQATYGEHTMLPGNRMPRPRRLPTGSLALDYVTGGGYALAHMARFWGAFSSGKTLAMFKAFISAQNFGALRHAQLMELAELALRAGESREAKLLKEQAKREREYGPLSCLFVNAEKSIDVAHMERLGIDMAKLEIFESSTIEDIGKTVYQSLRGYNVIGIDSTTATMSLSEIGDNNTDGDNIYGSYPFVRANAWGANMDWWRARLGRDNLIIITSHATQKIGGIKKAIGGSTPEHPPGGTKLFHEPAIILHFMKGGALKRKSNGALEDAGEDARGSATASAFGRFQAAGSGVVVKCDKNKVGVQGRAAVLHHDKRTGDFDNLHEYEKFASYFRVLAKSGSWWTLPGGSKTPQLRSTLEAQPELLRQIEAVALRCAEDPQYEAKVLAGQTEALVEIPLADAI
jgi:RecA/RadA recombinase